MFKLDHTHIETLTDADLRELIGRLCEAELRMAGLSQSAVTWGGDQRAADGGVDVDVSLPPENNPPGDWIKRARTAFQVKQETQPFAASKIKKEMAKNTALLAELIGSGGAYVIASGGDNPSHKARDERLNAMREAVASLSNADKLHLDFFGGDRIAQWANRHPGIVLWVRDRIGQPLEGWKPFGDWSAYPLETDAEYLADDHTGLIDEMRSALAKPEGIARLVGLSGMGKTRLAQALFDDRIGANALNPKRAAYTDIGVPSTPTARDAHATGS